MGSLHEEDAFEPVRISYRELCEPDLSSLSPRIERAFDNARSSLGLLLITDLPSSFPTLRRRALRAANGFASLPESVKDRYVHPEFRYSTGWSHGREIHNGKRDFLKASYYYNPRTDSPDVPSEDREGYPFNYAPNVWPSERDCPDFERSQKDMAALLVDVGTRVARACDDFIERKRMSTTTRGKQTESVAALIAKSQASKARLLHYLAPEGQVYDISKPSIAAEERQADDSWCGTHRDHGALTCLVPNMFLFHPADSQLDPIEIPPPSPTSGLYIKTRSGQTVQAMIPDDCIAVQTGETLELMSSSALAATPHFVYPGSGALSESTRRVILDHQSSDPAWKDVRRGTVTRETLACFFQPDVHDVVGAETGETFGQWTERVLSMHY